MRVTVWNENFQERTDERISAVYPEGIHGAIAAGLEAGLPGATIRTATMEMPDHGLTDEILEDTDVLVWWGHLKHGEVSDDVVERVRLHVLGGMGLLLLHSGIESKIASALLGTTCKMSHWRHGGRELLWTVVPSHPVVEGLPNPIVVPEGEMYGEPFDIPAPDDLVLITAYEGGEVLRSACGWNRGRGKVFFLATGHEEHAIYRQPEIRRLLQNTVQFVAPKAPHRPADLGVPQLPDGWWRQETPGSTPAQ